MSLLKSLDVSTDIVESTDSVGGGSMYGPLESDAYDMTIDTAYIDQSSGGAISLNLVFKSKEGKELRNTQYITSGKAKGQLPYYIDKKSGDKRFLPGFNVANDICLLTTGQAVNELETETKVLSLYDFTARKEIPQKKEVIMDLLGKEVTLGVQKVIEDKNVKNAEGVYVPSGETRVINEIDKVFRTSDKLTSSEIRAKATDPAFMDKWLSSNKDKTRNKAKGAVSGGTPAATSTDTPAAPTKSLFGA